MRTSKETVDQSPLAKGSGRKTIMAFMVFIDEMQKKNINNNKKKKYIIN